MYLLMYCRLRCSDGSHIKDAQAGDFFAEFGPPGNNGPPCLLRSLCRVCQGFMTDVSRVLAVSLALRRWLLSLRHWRVPRDRLGIYLGTSLKGPVLGKTLKAQPRSASVDRSSTPSADVILSEWMTGRAPTTCGRYRHLIGKSSPLGAIMVQTARRGLLFLYEARCWGESHYSTDTG